MAGKARLLSPGGAPPTRPLPGCPSRPISLVGRRRSGLGRPSSVPPGEPLPGARARWKVPALPVVRRFLGRLHDAAIHARRRQAFEKRQGTKSRLVGSGGAAGSMGIWP
jgi:hypothetical protein